MEVPHMCVTSIRHTRDLHGYWDNSITAGMGTTFKQLLWGRWGWGEMS